MPRKPKPVIKRRVQEEDWRIYYLLHGELPFAVGKSFEAFMFSGPSRGEERREVWDGVKDKLLPEWIHSNPCSRPGSGGTLRTGRKGERFLVAPRKPLWLMLRITDSGSTNTGTLTVIRHFLRARRHILSVLPADKGGGKTLGQAPGVAGTRELCRDF